MDFVSVQQKKAKRGRPSTLTTHDSKQWQPELIGARGCIKGSKNPSAGDHNRKIPDGAHSAIIEARAAGATYKSIGDQYDVSRERIRQILKKKAPSLTGHKGETISCFGCGETSDLADPHGCGPAERKSLKYTKRVRKLPLCLACARLFTGYKNAMVSLHYYKPAFDYIDKSLADGVKTYAIGYHWLRQTSPKIYWTNETPPGQSVWASKLKKQRIDKTSRAFTLETTHPWLKGAYNRWASLSPGYLTTIQRPCP